MPLPPFYTNFYNE